MHCDNDINLSHITDRHKVNKTFLSDVIVPHHEILLHNCAYLESFFINRSHESEYISIGPGEDCAPIPFSQDLFCEEL